MIEGRVYEFLIVCLFLKVLCAMFDDVCLLCICDVGNGYLRRNVVCTKFLMECR